MQSDIQSEMFFIACILSIIDMTLLPGPERPDLLKEELLHSIFLQTAVNYLQKIAIHWENEQITYYQLHQQALRIALTLHRTKPIGQGSIVGVQVSLPLSTCFWKRLFLPI